MRSGSLAAGVAVLACTLGAVVPSQAEVLFTATQVAPGSVTMTDQNLSGPTFGFFSGTYDLQITARCGGCLAATAPDGSSLGTFDMQIASGPFNFLSKVPSDGTQSAIPVGGTDFVHFGGFGTVLIPNSINFNNFLIGGGSNFEGFSVYGTPGSSTATIELDLDSFVTSNLLTLPKEPLYLYITGPTATALSLVDLTLGQTPDFQTFLTPLTVDFTVTLSDTPFSPSDTTTTTTSVPEPWTWTLMLAGLLGLAALTRRRAGINA